MADTNEKASAPKPAVSAPVVPHDRVVGLSLRNDGTPDQNNPELIGDKEAALELTKRQFAEFAVSAVDQQKRIELGLASSSDEDTSDKAIDALKAEHDKVAEAAEKQAEAIVNKLHQG